MQTRLGQVTGLASEYSDVDGASPLDDVQNSFHDDAGFSNVVLRLCPLKFKLKNARDRFIFLLIHCDRYYPLFSISMRARTWK